MSLDKPSLVEGEEDKSLPVDRKMSVENGEEGHNLPSTSPRSNEQVEDFEEEPMPDVLYHNHPPEIIATDTFQDKVRALRKSHETEISNLQKELIAMQLERMRFNQRGAVYDGEFSMPIRKMSVLDGGNPARRATFTTTIGLGVFTVPPKQSNSKLKKNHTGL